MIVLVYPKYVGGKFISNCLALSRHCVIQSKKLSQLDIAMYGKDNYYKFKLDSALKSLPGTAEMNQWSRYEYGCEDLYGINEEFYERSSIHDIKQLVQNSSIIETLRKNNKESCVIAHDYRVLMKYLLVHENVKLIEFANYEKFRNLAAKLKGGNINSAGYQDADRYYRNDQAYFQLESFKIDVDKKFLDWYQFDTMMQELYNYVGFDDYQPDLVKQFWSRYIELHE